jgi:hypothetical protein
MASVSQILSYDTKFVPYDPNSPFGENRPYNIKVIFSEIHTMTMHVKL